MLPSLLLLIFSEGIAAIHVVIAMHASEDSSEYNTDRTLSASGVEDFKSALSLCKDMCNFYLYCLLAEAGLRLVALSLGKARNSSVFRLLGL